MIAPGGLHKHANHGHDGTISKLSCNPYDMLIAWLVCVNGVDPAQTDKDATPLKGI